jgi:hypothetical protein
MVREGLTGGGQVKRASEPAIGTRFLGDLDAFPNAEMRSILEVRDALHVPLVKYRAAVIELAESIDIDILDPSFDDRATVLYRRVVEPALAELEELASHKTVRALLGTQVADIGAERLTAAGLGLAAATVADLPSLVGVAVGIAGDVLLGAWKERNEIESEQRTNAYYYLYEADRRLGR